MAEGPLFPMVDVKETAHQPNREPIALRIPYYVLKYSIAIGLRAVAGWLQVLVLGVQCIFCVQYSEYTASHAVLLYTSTVK